jgi:hypothetical protein
VVPLGINREDVRPATIAANSASIFVYAPLAVVSAGHPPVLSEKKVFTVEAIAPIALHGLLLLPVPLGQASAP